MDSAFAGQQLTAMGKGDLEISGQTTVEPVIGMADLTPAGTIWEEAYPASALRVEPASTPADWVDFLQYNLERVDVPAASDYGTDRFLDQSDAIFWDIVGAYGLTTLIGLTNWEWGSASFRFQSEGWFGEDTKYGGMDKFGHAYTGYILTEYFTQRIAHSADDRAGAALTGAVLGMGVQTYVEVLDGFSGGHGFSYEDFVMDGVGVGFSVLRNSIPGMADKIDFRMEYLPSGYGKPFAPVTDYSGQKYLLALKLGGFEAFDETPLRFVELQVGYFARGFSDDERKNGDELRREPYVAVGLNLAELLGATPAGNTTLGLAGRRAAEYLQVPYTYVPTRGN